MSYSGYGALGALGFVVVMGAYNMADRGMNWTAAKGSVFRIDRECGFTRVYEGGKQEAVRESCNSTDEFGEIARSGKRAKDVDGTAVGRGVADLDDGSARTADLRFDGRDDEFYKLKAGDEVAILVNNEDPAKIRTD
jgi:hypothetical protein